MIWINAKVVINLRQCATGLITKKKSFAYNLSLLPYYTWNFKVHQILCTNTINYLRELVEI